MKEGLRNKEDYLTIAPACRSTTSRRISPKPSPKTVVVYSLSSPLFLQSGSAGKSVLPSPSLSIPSLQARGPDCVFAGGGTGVFGGDVFGTVIFGDVASGRLCEVLVGKAKMENVGVGVGVAMRLTGKRGISAMR